MLHGHMEAHVRLKVRSAPFLRRVRRLNYSTCISGVLVLSFSPGCVSTSIPTLGVRPNQPNLEYSEAVVNRCKREVAPETSSAYADCLYFYNVFEWGQDLSEAYRTRATLNEWGVMAAGIIALAVVGSLTGLAAFNQAGSDAAKIIPLAGAFTAGAAALWDNKGRASAYTLAANAIDTALSAAGKDLTKANYTRNAETLHQAITKAKNELETKRSEFANIDERLKNAEENIKALQDQLKSKQEPTPTTPSR